MVERKPPKPRKCPVCRDLYTRTRGIQPTCGRFACEMDYANRSVRKRARIEIKRRNQERRVALDAIKPLKTLRSEAQAVFNRFIRLRDAALPCISCDDPDPPHRFGGAWDAGHFRTVAAAPALRFNEDNCHKQCKSCNGGKANFSSKKETVTAAYELELVRRIGPERVAWIKGPHAEPQWRHDDYREFKRIYTAKCSQLRAAAKAPAPGKGD